MNPPSVRRGRPPKPRRRDSPPPPPEPVPPPPLSSLGIGPDRGKDFFNKDAIRLCSMIHHNEELLYKKRRWLMGSSTTSTSEGNPRRPKKPKFLKDVSLLESHIRSDEVSCDNVRTTVERSFGSSRYTHESHHVVPYNLQRFDLHKMENRFINPSYLKKISSIVNDLNNDALFLVANIVTDNKISFIKTRPRMKKIIKEYLPKVFTEANFMEQMVPLQQLSQIFRNPGNLRERQLTLSTPVTPSLLSAIHKTIEVLDHMPHQDLYAVNRKLRSVPDGVPHFPPGRFRSESSLLERTKKRLNKFVLGLEEGDDLPKPLSKALSVMLLSLKQKTRSVDILTSEFFPFSPEIIGLQNDILRSIWLLPKIKHFELNNLKDLVYPDAKVSRKTFRIALKKYLKECLFCLGDEIDIPENLVRTLAFINRRSLRHPLVYQKEMREDVQAVLNLSSHLKQVVENLLLDHSNNEKILSPCSEMLESDDDSESNDFDLSGNNYCCSPGEREGEHIVRSCTNDKEEASGESRPISFSVYAGTNSYYSPQFDGAVRGMITNDPKLEENDNINDVRPCPEEPCPEEPTQSDPHSSPQESGDMSQVVIQEICDDTSLFSYRLIGHMLDNFLQTDGIDVDAITRFYLRGRSSPPPGSQDKETPLVLNRAVDELLPPLPESCIARVKKLIEKP